MELTNKREELEKEIAEYQGNIQRLTKALLGAENWLRKCQMELSEMEERDQKNCEDSDGK